MNAESSPVCGRMRRERQRASASVGGEPKHAAEQRTYHHGGGPDLVRRTRGERLVVSAGEDFGDVAQRAVQREERIGSEIRVGWLRAVIAILSDAGPAGEQRPDGAVVITAAAEFWRVIGDDTHAPVGLVVGAGKLRDHS